LDAHQDHLAGRQAEQAQVVEQSGDSRLVCVPRIDFLWTRAAKIHPDGMAGRQAGIHRVDDQKSLTPANLGQQIRSDGAAIDEAGHGSDARVSPQHPDGMDADSVIGQQEVTDADDGNGPWRIKITVSARLAS
jgi:hypothetical protein